MEEWHKSKVNRFPGTIHAILLSVPGLLPDRQPCQHTLDHPVPVSPFVFARAFLICQIKAQRQCMIPEADIVFIQKILCAAALVQQRHLPAGCNELFCAGHSDLPFGCLFGQYDIHCTRHPDRLGKEITMDQSHKLFPLRISCILSGRNVSRTIPFPRSSLLSVPAI